MAQVSFRPCHHYPDHDAGGDDDGDGEDGPENYDVDGNDCLDGDMDSTKYTFY